MTSKPLTNVTARYVMEQSREQVFREFSHLSIGKDTPTLMVPEVLDEIVRLRAKVQWLEEFAEQNAATERGA